MKRKRNRGLGNAVCETVVPAITTGKKVKLRPWTVYQGGKVVAPWGSEIGLSQQPPNVATAARRCGASLAGHAKTRKSRKGR